jgi:DNA-binding MarR family transcriptional regulator
MADWRQVSFVVRSRHRTSLLSQLQGGPQTPSVLASRLHISVSHTSQLLSGLSKKGLVVCLTPTLPRGRLYQLTPKGSRALADLPR